jgi:hypothetical protein
MRVVRVRQSEMAIRCLLVEAAALSEGHLLMKTDPVAAGLQRK